MKNFIIHKDKGLVSNEFLNLNIADFQAACEYVAGLSYKRNPNKHHILCVFEDFGGTCSTKHALLRKLALENNHPDVTLVLGIFKMDAEYTSKIKNTLESYAIKYIPEAHNYLKIGEEYFDFTKPDSDYNQFINTLLTEKEIEYHEIVEDKILFHKNFLQKWLIDEKLPFSLNEIWDIREQCIKDLQKTDEEEIFTLDYNV